MLATAVRILLPPRDCPEWLLGLSETPLSTAIVGVINVAVAEVAAAGCIGRFVVDVADVV